VSRVIGIVSKRLVIDTSASRVIAGTYHSVRNHPN
jgi:hypothetical protein